MVRPPDITGSIGRRSLLLTICLCSVLLVIRNASLYPSVFADEYYYSRFSRLVSFSQANVPNYLYFSLYRLTNQCGDGFLQCARLLNVVFLLASVPLIYRVARCYSTRLHSVLMVVFALLRRSIQLSSCRRLFIFLVFGGF